MILTYLQNDENFVTDEVQFAFVFFLCSGGRMWGTEQFNVILGAKIKIIFIL